MSKKNYIELAKIIKNAYYLSKSGRLELTKQLSTYLKKDNPQFDRDKFITACTDKED